MPRHLLVLLTLSLLVAPAARTAPSERTAAQQAYAAGGTPLRLLVRLKASSAPTRGPREQRARDIRAWAEQRGLAVRAARSLGGRFATLTLDAAAGSDDASASLSALAADPEVEYAEIDQRRHAHAVPIDALYAEQWYLQDQQVGAANFQAAWDLTAGHADTVIAVLDTGVRFDHPDLAGERLLAGYDFVDADDSLGTSFVAANDGDGWDADASDPGDWMTLEEDTSGPLASCDLPWEPNETLKPSSWHGTRVTGIIAAITNNGVGISGGTWSSRVLPVRVLGKCGGYDSDIVTGMRWAAGLRVDGTPTNPDPAQIINLSLGSAGSCSRAYRDAVAELQAIGVLVVASAGNEDGDPVDSPANCPGVLAVAGLRHIGTKVGYSNQGPEVGISAPAGNCPEDPVRCGGFSLITTTDTGETVPAEPAYTSDAMPNIGTSFSAPIVSAIAGLMHGANPALGVTELITRMQAGARPFAQDPTIPTCPDLAPLFPQKAQCNCTTTTCGAGIADALGAVTEALQPIARIVQPPGTTAGRNVTLDGTGSAAARGRALASYSWSVVSGTADFVGAADGDTAIVAVPASGLVTVRLDVADDHGATDSAEVTLGTTASSSGSGSGGGGGGALDPALLASLLLLARRRPRAQL